METEQLCIYCRSRPADTRDHVPPKAVFPAPRPSDLVSVPACTVCNSESSKQDEEFAFWLSWYVGPRTPVTADLFEQRAIRTGRHNRRIGERILHVARPVELHTASGLYLGNLIAIPWDSAPYLPVIQRIVRGLYFHHLNSALDLGRPVEAQLSAVPPTLDPPLPLSLHEVGGGQFRYGYCHNDVDPQSSFWVLEFHQRLWAIANTLAGQQGAAADEPQRDSIEP